MKAARIQEYGGADKVIVEDIEAPYPAKGQVLVKVHAASINPFDIKIRNGAMKDAIPLELPMTLGGDFAGEVVEVGEGVDGFAAADAVFGQAHVAAGNSGAFAEMAVTSAEQMARMPEVDFEKAAALPLTGVSALQALEDHMQLTSGQKILIHGAAGGIGTIAVQLAKHLGAYVAATATGDGVEYVRSLGADEVIDYKAQVFEDILQDYDAVYDTVGGETYKRSFSILRSGGVIVSMLEQPDTELEQKHAVRAIAQQTNVTMQRLARLAELVNQGVIVPHVDDVYILDDIHDAFQDKENGAVKGKIVLRMNA